MGAGESRIASGPRGRPELIKIERFESSILLLKTELRRLLTTFTAVAGTGGGDALFAIRPSYGDVLKMLEATGTLSAVKTLRSHRWGPQRLKSPG